MQSHWDSSYGKEESIEWLRTLALSHLEDVLQEPQCADLFDLIDRRDWRAVVEFEPRYNDDGNVYSYIALRQALAFFSKNKGLPPLGIDTRAVAYQKFVEAEALCELTNECFTAWEEGKFQFPPLVEAVLHGALRKISQILGDVPPLSDINFRFGPGATANIPKRLANARLKLSSSVECSENLLPHVSRFLREMPFYLDSLEGEEYTASGYECKRISCEITAGRLDFVAKSAKTDRAIVVEPLLNTLVQAGLGRAIADRLCKHGQDIRDQKRNARLAKEGSLTGALATLDLSSASDTLSKGIVRHLLPYEWYDLLNAARTSSVRYGKTTIRLSKFSSMGNGFTFPLETLIFYSLALATCQHVGAKGPVSVYGDDIVIPVAAVDPFMRVLRSLGFIPNPSKSFWEGPFRESCGKDYYRGIDIRPVYVKDVLTVADAFVLHNYYVGRSMSDFASRVLQKIPTHLRLWGPPGYGDGHLHGKWEGARSPKSGSHGYSGWTFETWSFSTPKSKRVLPGDYLYPAYSIYLKGESAPRRPEKRYAKPDKLKPDVMVTRTNTQRILLPGDVEAVTAEAGRAPISHQVYDRKRRQWTWNTPLPGRGQVRKLSIYTLESPSILF